MSSEALDAVLDAGKPERKFRPTASARVIRAVAGYHPHERGGVPLRPRSCTRGRPGEDGFRAAFSVRPLLDASPAGASFPLVFLREHRTQGGARLAIGLHLGHTPPGGGDGRRAASPTGEAQATRSVVGRQPSELRRIAETENRPQDSWTTSVRKPLLPLRPGSPSPTRPLLRRPRNRRLLRNWADGSAAEPDERVAAVRNIGRSTR